MKAEPSSENRRKRAWSESDEDEPQDRRLESSPGRENSAEMQQESEGEIKDDNEKPNGDAAEEDDED